MNIENLNLLGAICGDIIGSSYEFTTDSIPIDFPLFNKDSKFTDDTVLTLAVAKGLISGYSNENNTYNEVVKSLEQFAKKYPTADYGKSFLNWLTQSIKTPYNSFGNGSAMRVSSVAWLYDTLEEVEKYAHITASITHNHPEGLKGATVIAVAIFLAREKHHKEYIKKYIETKYNYNLSKSYDEIKAGKTLSISCEDTVPKAIIAFLEGNTFEEVIRLAVTLCGDTDTIGAMAGSIAEAYYPIDIQLKEKVFSILDKDLQDSLLEFNEFLSLKCVIEEINDNIK